MKQSIIIILAAIFILSVAMPTFVCAGVLGTNPIETVRAGLHDGQQYIIDLLWWMRGLNFPKQWWEFLIDDEQERPPVWIG